MLAETHALIQPSDGARPLLASAVELVRGGYVRQLRERRIAVVEEQRRGKP